MSSVRTVRGTLVVRCTAGRDTSSTVHRCEGHGTEERPSRPCCRQMAPADRSSIRWLHRAALCCRCLQYAAHSTAGVCTALHTVLQVSAPRCTQYCRCLHRAAYSTADVCTALHTVPQVAAPRCTVLQVSAVRCTQYCRWLYRAAQCAAGVCSTLHSLLQISTVRFTQY